jgi:molybdopterin-guanine dinucleotide biosynthesis protein A
MPVTKAFIHVEGKRIIERNIGVLKTLFKEIFIVTNQPEKYIYLGVPLLGDIYNVRGPMTGIFTALSNSGHWWSFISACDMPFLNKDLIKYMALQRNRNDAVVPRINKRTEPLFAFYSKRLLPHMERAILAGNTGLQDFLQDKKVKYILGKQIKGIDAEGRSFINLNTPEDVYFHQAAGAFRTIEGRPHKGEGI